MGDDFLFGLGLSYATVRCDPAGIGTESPIVDPTRPWSDDLLDTSTEFILSAGDEFDIVVDYVKALRTDPVAVGLPRRDRAHARRSAIRRRVIGSAGCCGSRWARACSTSRSSGAPATATAIRRETTSSSRARRRRRHPGTGSRSISSPRPRWCSSAPPRRGTRSRTTAPTSSRGRRTSGTSTWRSSDSRIPSSPTRPTGSRSSGRSSLPATTGSMRSSLRRPSGSARRTIRRSSATPTGTHSSASSAGSPSTRLAYRLPEVAVGENQYIPVDPSYDDGSFLGFFRVIGGGHVDLTDNFTDHEAYVDAVTLHADGPAGAGLPARSGRRRDHPGRDGVGHRAVRKGSWRLPG